MAFPNVRARTAGVGVLRLAVAGAMGLLVVPLLAGPSSAADFSNTTAIQGVRLPPPSGCPTPSGCPSEKASPYPSNISVSGLTGTISDVNVTLKGFTYGDAEGGGPPDIDLMVVAPDGKAVMVMSDACGTNENRNPISTPIDLTFDDSAAGFLPADAPCVSGTYKPIDDDDDGPTLSSAFQTEDGFPAPAPTPPPATLPLATFNGISPNGTWSLYMVDDGPSGTSGIDGQFAGGWSLSITTAATPTSSTPSSTTASSTSSTSSTLSTSSTSSTSSTVASSTTSTTRALGVTPTTTRIPVTGSENGSMAVIGAMFLLIGVAVVTLPHRRPWRDGFPRRR